MGGGKGDLVNFEQKILFKLKVNMPQLKSLSNTDDELVFIINFMDAKFHINTSKITSEDQHIRLLD